MAFFTTTDGTNIFYKDWGPRDAQPIVFHHGNSCHTWPHAVEFPIRSIPQRKTVR